VNIYIAGPMTGLPEFNFPLFNKVARELRAQGHECFNPAERDLVRHPEIDFTSGDVEKVKSEGFSLRDALADDTHYICKVADAIIMLPGWEISLGARAEHALATALKHIIIYLPPTEFFANARQDT
jgi:Domain of unknown function (DUF4406)